MGRITRETPRCVRHGVLTLEPSRDGGHEEEGSGILTVKAPLQFPKKGNSVTESTRMEFSVHTAAFSASSRLFDLNGEANSASKKHNSATIAHDVRRFGHESIRTEVFGTHTSRVSTPNLNLLLIQTHMLRQPIVNGWECDDYRHLVNIQPVGFERATCVHQSKLVGHRSKCQCRSEVAADFRCKGDDYL